MIFDPKIFGENFHQFVQTEYNLFGPVLSLIFHIATIIILGLVFLYGNKYKKIFIAYFTVNFTFLFCYWGIYGTIYWYKIGIPYLIAYGITPILLGLILIQWFKEIKKSKIDLDLLKVNKWKFIVLLFLIWGVWYPTYIYGEGFILNFKDLLLSFYGLMPCPTIMVVLSLLTLKYPNTNKKLYNLFTAYALLIGTATVASGWLPDIPFIILGIYALIFIFIHKKHK